MEIFKRFSFDAAHRLPQVPVGHPCGALHGHSYEVEVHVRGPVGAATGWVIDFAEIAAAYEPARRQLDHACLNDIPGLENPTSEVLARWLWDRLRPHLPGLASVVISETRSSGCIFRGEAE